jgi:hypothetical protein
MHGEGGVAEDGLGTRRGDLEFASALDLIEEMVDHAKLVLLGALARQSEHGALAQRFVLDLCAVRARV